MRNVQGSQCPTHLALETAQASEINASLRKAKAILSLIQHDGADDTDEAFYTNESIIRTALTVIDDYISRAQAEMSNGAHFHHSDAPNGRKGGKYA